ncbi:MAG: DUF1330 domain-containing protein [Rhodospirillales bacterium]|nr:DUF1330 domain-containing protein [Rhodospirillales bacterium]
MSTKGYVFAAVDVTDQAIYDAYRAQVLPTITAYGGRFLVRGGAPDKREGGLAVPRAVILEFPSVEQAKSWYDGPEYAPLKALRMRGATAELVILTGIEA